MSEGGDHESWDDEMMMNENNETPLPVVSISAPFWTVDFLLPSFPPPSARPLVRLLPLFVFNA